MSNPNAVWLGSPNFWPGRLSVDVVVIHTMVGTVASANARFQNPQQQASAHYGVGEDGRIWQWVNENDSAWHAGNADTNRRSIGIEHEDNGDYNGVRPPALYAASAALVRDICNRHRLPIDAAHIRPHHDFTATACPDALDVGRIIREAAQAAPPPTPEDDDLITAFTVTWPDGHGEVFRISGGTLQHTYETLAGRQWSKWNALLGADPAGQDLRSLISYRFDGSGALEVFAQANSSQVRHYRINLTDGTWAGWEIGD